MAISFLPCFPPFLIKLVSASPKWNIFATKLLLRIWTNFFILLTSGITHPPKPTRMDRQACVNVFLTVSQCWNISLMEGDWVETSCHYWEHFPFHSALSERECACVCTCMRMCVCLVSLVSLVWSPSSLRKLWSSSSCFIYYQSQWCYSK